jgi:hypothetical protein
MTIQELFIRSNEELRKVIDRIHEDQWMIEMPAGLTSKPATLGESVRNHTYDDAWVSDVLAGKTAEEVGEKYEYLLSSEDILMKYDTFNQFAIDAVKGFTDLERIVHLSYGNFSAHDYLQHIISYRAFRCYDIAKLIGIDTTMAADLVDGLTEEFTPVIESYRQMGVFPPATAVEDSASPQVKLLALVGRQ